MHDGCAKAITSKLRLAACARCVLPEVCRDLVALVCCCSHNWHECQCWQHCWAETGHTYLERNEQEKFTSSRPRRYFSSASAEELEEKGVFEGPCFPFSAKGVFEGLPFLPLPRGSSWVFPYLPQTKKGIQGSLFSCLIPRRGIPRSLFPVQVTK